MLPRRFSLLLFSMILALATAARAQEPIGSTAVPLFTLAGPTPSASATAGQLATLNQTGPLPATLLLNLSPTVQATAEQESATAAPGGGWLWHGRIQNQQHSQVTLLLRDGQLWGNIRWPQAIFMVRPLPHTTTGQHLIEQVDETGLIELPDDSVTSADQFFPSLGRIPTDDGSVIDLLIAYTPSVRQALGDEAAVRALLDLLVAETNTTYANSNITQRLRLVQAVEVNYTEAGPSQSTLDLTRLAGTADGFMDEIHAVRDTYGADLVHLMYENGDCGLGYVYAPFSVSSRSCAATNLTMAHELGHNMGARHDWYVDAAVGNPNGYTGNHGFVYPAGGWRTIMAYNNLCAALATSCTRLPYWANPAKFYNTVSMGVAEGTSIACAAGNSANPPCDADTRLTLNRTALAISNQRQTQLMATAAITADTTAAYPGQAIVYTITIRNDSAVSALNVVITAPVPAHTTLDSGTLSGDASTTGTGAGSTITWNTAAVLTPGQTLTRSYRVWAQTSGTTTSTASVGSSNSLLTHTSPPAATTIVQTAACGFSEGFEAGVLSSYWAVETAAQGRVRVLPNLPHTGSYSAVLDDTTDDLTYSTAALILTADLSGRTTADLDFAWYDLGDEYQAASDGVFVRTNPSAAWVKVYDFSGNSNSAYQTGHVDLENAGQAFGAQFQIKFQFYDNFGFNPANVGAGDGYALDDLALSCPLPQITLTQTVDDPFPDPDQLVYYQIGIQNNGLAPATQAVLSDTLPSGVSFVGPVLLAGSGGTVASSAADFPTLASNLTIPAGQSVTVTLPVRVGAAELPGTTITNLVAFTSAEISTPRTAAAPFMVDGALLQPRLRPTDIIPEQGQLLEMVLTLPNVGPAVATNLIVSGTLEAGLVMTGPVTLIGTTGTTATGAADLPLLARDFNVAGLGSVELRVPLQIAADAPLGVPLTFTATVQYDQTAVPLTVTATVKPSIKKYSYLPVILK